MKIKKRVRSQTKCSLGEFPTLLYTTKTVKSFKVGNTLGRIFVTTHISQQFNLRFPFIYVGRDGHINVGLYVQGRPPDPPGGEVQHETRMAM